MRIHIFEHVPYEGPGQIAQWAAARGHGLTVTRFFADEPLPALDTIDLLVVMGGPMSVNDEETLPWLKTEKQFIRTAITGHKKVLGICLGAQLIASALGARVHANSCPEIGWFPLALTDKAAAHPLFAGVAPRLNVFQWHGETFELPAHALHAAFSELCRNQAFVLHDRVVGLQFHIESRPADVELLVRHCGEGLPQGPSVQPLHSLTADRKRFETIHTALQSLLDNLEAVS